jgi:hypothetical protein
MSERLARELVCDHQRRIHKCLLSQLDYRQSVDCVRQGFGCSSTKIFQLRLIAHTSPERVGAVVCLVIAALAMKGRGRVRAGVQDRRLWVRLREKGGNRHEMPCHHNLETYLHTYLDGSGISADPKGPLFSHHRPHDRQLTRTPLPQANAHAMIRRRAASGGIKTQVANHTFRATCITAYVKNGGTLENAAAHGEQRISI